MTQEPCLTEWMDEVPYPGPSVEDDLLLSVRVFVNAIHQFGKQLLRMELEVIEQAFNGVKQTYEALLPGMTYYSKTIAKFVDDTVPPVRDQDQPAHITIIRNHGPYAGSGYDRRGRKRY